MKIVSDFVPLSALRGDAPRYWRSMAEYRRVTAPDEDDDAAGPVLDEMSRRRFLQLSAASMALAGVTGCTRQPVEKILPYVNQPEQVVPGKPLYFATAVPVNGRAQGVLVESHLGRPTKVEGNPDHPASRGATSVHAQASVLDLYDPDRAKGIRHLGKTQSWSDFLIALNRLLEPLRPKQGAGLHILTEGVASPTLADRIAAVQHAFPRAQWHQYDAAGQHSARAGATMAFGRPVNTIYRFERADVIVALDADFLVCGPDSTRLTSEFANRRTRGDRTDMNRLYVVESTMTATGGKADHRLRLRYSEVEDLARALAAAVGVAAVTTSTRVDPEWITAVSNDLLAHRGNCAVIAGEQQSPVVHALAHAMNQSLANVGQTVLYTEPLEAQPVDQIESLRELVRALDAGEVELLLVLGGNPVYDAPSDFNFRTYLPKAQTSIRMGLYDDETSALCHWPVPESHFYEEWSDARAFDGTVTILQPLIEPLYDTRSQAQLLDAIATGSMRTSHELVRDYWRSQKQGSDFESWWRKSLHDGLVTDSALPEIHPALRSNTIPPPSAAPRGQLEITFRPDPYIYDGRFANNAWLQELPQPMSKLTWDNVAHISPSTAQRLQLTSRDRVKLKHRGAEVEITAWVTPGQPDDSITVNLGGGRWRAGRAGNGAGANVYPLRFSDALWAGSGVEVEKVGAQYPLASTQMHQRMEGRDLVIAGDVERYKGEPQFVRQTAKIPPEDLTLYPKWEYPDHKWGMSIDLTRCVNCNACVVACQAENNIAVVGKEQVLASREMHWLRIDTYYDGDAVNPSAHYQPVPCMQCENAPCELVCPVQATVHSSDGLNDMVYNRCIGTRYCSNNCPYKVRRFNFLLFQDWQTETLKLQRNPDVTVRSRGVMEKCTYCVQRIREAEIQAQLEDRGIRDGEIQTACQQSCPAQAIIFGDINDKKSRVAQLKQSALDYPMLAELNTRPRTTYLAELRNPNPELRKRA